MGGTPAASVDWGKYQSPANAPSVDWGSYSGASALPDTNDYWNRLKQKHGVPINYDLAKSYLENAQGGELSDADLKQVNTNLEGVQRAVAEANPERMPEGYFGRAWDEVKRIARGVTTESGGAAFGNPQESTQVAGFAPPVNPVPAIKQRFEEAKEHPLAAAGALTADMAAAAAPLLPGALKGTMARINPMPSIESALGRTLNAAEAEAPRAGGQIQPALNNTPREVLEHASKEGIHLTPGQATEDPLAQHFQKAGTTAAMGGKDLANALAENRTKFGQSVNTFMDAADPKRMGLSAEQAGESINQSAKTARGVAHDNAAQGYEKINYLMDSPVEPSAINDAWKKIRGDLPMGAEGGILAQTPRSMRAVVEDLLSGNSEGFKPTVQETIQLRKFFRDLGDTEGLPDKTQATYKKMEGAASSALDATAAKEGASEDWKAANAGWKDYVSKYGDRNSPFYKLINQRDPTRIVTMLQNAPATDILAIKNEGMDSALEPLRRQVVQGIARNRFNVGRDGLGGYSDSYLKALFGDAQTKELYLKGDIAKRLNYDPNPSGTGSNIASIEQLKLGTQAKISAAAKLSMPRDPLSYLPPKATASGPSRGSLPQPISISKPSPTTSIFDESLATANAPRPNLAGGPAAFEQSRLPQYVYRVHDEGMPGIDLGKHAHATGSAAEAQSYAGSRSADTPQVVSRIKTSNFKPGEIEVMQGPNGQKWYKFNRQLTNADYERADASSTGNRRSGN